MLLVTFAGGRGVFTYRDLGGADAAAIRRLVPESLALLGRLRGRVEGEAVAHIVGRGGNLLRNGECGKHRSHPEHQPKADARVHR